MCLTLLEHIRSPKELIAISKIIENAQQETQEAQEKKPTATARTFDIIFTVFVYLLAAGILIGAIFFAFNTSPDKSLFGIRYYTVLTGSMEPAYNVGDMIFVQIKDADDINVNDVITFNPSKDSEAYLTHRVIEKYENYQGTGVTCFRTKGDANNSEDSFLIESDRVIGTVQFGIPKLGYIVRFIQLRWYLVVPIIIMIAVFLYLLKRYFNMGKSDDENDGSEPPQTEISGMEESAGNTTVAENDMTVNSLSADNTK